MKPIDLIKQMSDEHIVALLSGMILEYPIGPKWQRFDILMDPMKVQEIRIVKEDAPKETVQGTATNRTETNKPVDSNTPKTGPVVTKKRGLLGLFP